MAKRKKQIKVYIDEKYLLIDGVKYKAKQEKFKKIGKEEHSDYIILEEIDKKDYESKLNFIRDKLKNKISKEEVIEEILKDLQLVDIDKLNKILKTKKPKIRKQKGCLGISVDGGKHNRMYIDIFD